MPARRRSYRRKSFKGRGRRTYKRRVFRRGGRKSRMSKISKTHIRGLFIPDQLKTKLRYCDNYQMLNNAGSSSAIYTFRANGLYDVDRTGIGHQPMGFDQYGALYSHYYIGGSSIKVKTYNNNTRITKLMVIPSLDAFTSATLLTHKMDEQPYCKKAVMGYSTGQGRTKLTHYCTTKKLYGRNPHMTSDYQGVSAVGSQADPANQWFWNVVHQDMLYGTTAGFVNSVCEVEITFYVTFLNRVDPVASSEGAITTGESAVDTVGGIPSGISLGGL